MDIQFFIKIIINSFVNVFYSYFLDFITALCFAVCVVQLFLTSIPQLLRNNDNADALTATTIGPITPINMPTTLLFLLYIGLPLFPGCTTAEIIRVPISDLSP